MIQVSISQIEHLLNKHRETLKQGKEYQQIALDITLNPLSYTLYVIAEARSHSTTVKSGNAASYTC